jgi:DNA gyrase subunit A
MDLETDDVLVSAKLSHEEDEVVMVTSDGQSVRFPVAELRSASRASGGVRGVRLGKGAHAVSMEVASTGDQLLTLTANGFGKRTPIEEYPTHHRGGGGVITFKVLDSTGPVTAARMVKDSQELIVISQEGIVLRTRMDGISIQGRSTQGVSVIGPGPGDAVASVAIIEMDQEQEAASADGPQDAQAPEDQGSATKAKEPQAKEGTATASKAKTSDPGAEDRAALSKADAALSKAKAVAKAQPAKRAKDTDASSNGSSGERRDGPARRR